ncbi:MAG TPA: TetR/AcrR family transcriptional regulator, partial [Syntrophomonadaceae bacterium]|nr:TetR/AcrR family transcriptional regulator [Syntrophomonadaceae bacterium]
MRNSKEDTEAVKKLIIEKAIEVFSQKGYEATNMQDIADAAGISRGPLYYHFKNKKDLYNYVIDVYINYNLDKYIEIFDQNTPIIKKIEDDLYY